jgi:ABC-type transport system involved in multi-copper enzyme maturation permease subunit
MTTMTSDEIPAKTVRTDTGDRRYKLPSAASQVISVFAVQMRLYMKSKVALLYIVLALMIPVLALAGVADSIVNFLVGTPATVSYLLFMLLLFIIIIPAMLAGRILSSEFRDRTVYMSFPLPVSRTTFYTGKFLAAQTLVIGIFSMAYGFALLCGSDMPSYPNDILGSYIVCMAGVFALTAMAFGLSPFFRKGSTGLVIALMFFLPIAIFIAVGAFGAGVEALMTIPPFAGFFALYMIDMGVGGILFAMFLGGTLEMFDWWIYVAVSLIWGALFFALGCIKMNKREL